MIAGLGPVAGGLTHCGTSPVLRSTAPISSVAFSTAFLVAASRNVP